MVNSELIIHLAWRGERVHAPRRYFVFAAERVLVSEELVIDDRVRERSSHS